MNIDIHLALRAIIALFFLYFSFSVQSQAADTVQSLSRRTVAVFDIAEKSEDSTTTIFSFENLLQAAGIPYVVTQNLAEAVNHGMIIVSSSVYKGILNKNDKKALIKYVTEGGILIMQRLSDRDLFNLGGVKNYKTSSARYRMTWDATSNDPALRWIDDPMEKTISLGNERYESVITTRSFDVSTARILARFDDGSAAVIRNGYGAGYTYVVGFSFKDLILRNELNNDYSAQRIYSNGFEPTSDTIILFVRALYQTHFPFAAWKHTSPYDSRAALIITHDCDSTSAMLMMNDFADLEFRYGITATYNITTHYIHDVLSKDYYTPFVEDIKLLLDKGHRVASHSVGHFPDFYSSSIVPMGEPGNTMENYRPYNDGRTNTIGATVYGELEVSKWLLENEAGATVSSFRSGHLAFNKYQILVMDELGYRYDSSNSANDVLTNFPYRCLTLRSFSGEPSNIYEIPMTISDVKFTEETRDQMVSTWLDIIEKNGANHAPTVLLIHPNRRWKLESEEKFLDMLPQDIAIIDTDSFGDYWRHRDSVQFRTTLRGNVLFILFPGNALPLDEKFSLIVENGQGLDDIVAQTENSQPVSCRKIPWQGNDMLISFAAGR